MSAVSPAGADAAAVDDGESFRSCFGRLFLLTLLFFMNFMARIVQAPLMPAIEKDLDITHAEAGSLFLTLSIGYFIGLMGSGFVSARITHRRTMVLSIACGRHRADSDSRQRKPVGAPRRASSDRTFHGDLPALRHRRHHGVCEPTALG